jgi:hypothetical protein
MNTPEENDPHRGQPAHRIRLPGFLLDKEIGLGDIIKRATSYVGIAPCSACEDRAESLNEWIGFGPGTRR